jgi:hypothetical protein
MQTLLRRNESEESERVPSPRLARAVIEEETASRCPRIRCALGARQLSPKKEAAMSRVVQKSAALFSVVFALFLLPIAWKVWLAPTAHAGGDSEPPPPAPLVASDTAIAALRAGLGPDALCAAGLTAQQAGPIVTNLEAAAAASPGSLAAADAGYAAAGVTTDVLRRKIESGLASQQEVASYAAEMQSLATATAQRQAAIDALFTAGTQSLPLVVVAKLQRIRANRSWELPLEFAAVDRSQQEWVALREALLNEKTCAKYDDPPDPALVATLAAARAQADVALAKTNLTTNLAAVTIAWNASAE